MPKKSSQKVNIKHMTIDELFKSVQFGRAWLGVNAQTELEASLLLRQWEPVFQHWTAESGYDEFRVNLPDGSYIPVHASNTPLIKPANQPMLTITSDTIDRFVWNNPNLPNTKEMLQVMDRLIQSDRPMALTTNEDIGIIAADTQVWINQIACDLLQSSGQQAVMRNMKRFWSEEDLNGLHNELRDTDRPIEFSYRARLNDEQYDTWFESRNTYQNVTINGRSFRLGTVIPGAFRIIGTLSPV